VLSLKERSCRKDYFFFAFFLAFFLATFFFAFFLAAMIKSPVHESLGLRLQASNQTEIEHHVRCEASKHQ
jgi:hypothetical protein